MGEEGNQVPCTVGAAHATRDRAGHVGMMRSLCPAEGAGVYRGGQREGVWGWPWRGVVAVAGGLICQEAVGQLSCPFS